MEVEHDPSHNGAFSLANQCSPFNPSVLSSVITFPETYSRVSAIGQTKHLTEILSVLPKTQLIVFM